MNGIAVDDDFVEIAQQNFEKVSRTVGKIGYKEGAYDGRQSVFQNGFDIGFEHGFRIGFRLGTQIGQLNATTDISNKATQSTAASPTTTDLILKRPTRGQCVVCTDQNLINENIDKVVDLQQKHNDKVNETLASRYSQLNN